MKVIDLVGLLLIIGGIIVLAMNGFSFTKDRDEVKLGPIELAAEEKGFVPPIAGAVAIGAGLVLIVAGRAGRR